MWQIWKRKGFARFCKRVKIELSMTDCQKPLNLKDKRNHKDLFSIKLLNLSFPITFHVLIANETYRINNKVTLMFSSIRCNAGNVLRQLRISVKEMRKTQCNGETVVAICYVAQSFGQTLSCGRNETKTAVISNARSRLLQRKIAWFLNYAITLRNV